MKAHAAKHPKALHRLTSCEYALEPRRGGERESGSEVGERKREQEGGGEGMDCDGVRDKAVNAVQHRVAAQYSGSVFCAQASAVTDTNVRQVTKY